ncbi:MAG: Ldh family oxidoreductase [Geminicoccaceae bacterium]
MRSCSTWRRRWRPWARSRRSPSAARRCRKDGWSAARRQAPDRSVAARRRFMLPIGGPKGFGLSVAIGLLAGVLNQAAFGSDVIDFTSESQRSSNTGQFVAAIDIAAFGPLDTFTASVDKAFSEMRASEPLPGHARVRSPGEGKAALMAERRAKGIALHASLRKDLDDIAREIGVAPL